MSSGNVFAKSKNNEENEQESHLEAALPEFRRRASGGNSHELELASAIMPGGEAVINSAGQVGAEHL